MRVSPVYSQTLSRQDGKYFQQVDRCARAGQTGYDFYFTMHGSVQSADGMPADTMMRRLRFQDLLKTSTMMSRSRWVASKQMIHGSCSTENMSLAPVTHA